MPNVLLEFKTEVVWWWKASNYGTLWWKDPVVKQEGEDGEAAGSARRSNPVVMGHMDPWMIQL